MDVPDALTMVVDEVIARFLAGDYTLADVRGSFTNGIWSPHLDGVDRAGALRLLIAEDDYPREMGGQMADGEARARLREILGG